VTIWYASRAYVVALVHHDPDDLVRDRIEAAVVDRGRLHEFGAGTSRDRERFEGVVAALRHDGALGDQIAAVSGAPDPLE